MPAVGMVRRWPGRLELSQLPSPRQATPCLSLARLAVGITGSSHGEEEGWAGRECSQEGKERCADSWTEREGWRCEARRWLYLLRLSARSGPPNCLADSPCPPLLFAFFSSRPLSLGKRSLRKSLSTPRPVGRGCLKTHQFNSCVYGLGTRIKPLEVAGLTP